MARSQMKMSWKTFAKRSLIAMNWDEWLRYEGAQTVMNQMKQHNGIPTLIFGNPRLDAVND